MKDHTTVQTRGTDPRTSLQRVASSLGLVVCAILTWLCAGFALAGEEAPGARIKVRLVADLDAGTLVSDLEELHPVVTTVFDETGSKMVTLGERATLWVRNAKIDDKDEFGFEYYYQGKYISRSGELAIDPEKLGVGKHFINPGNHQFTLAEDGTLSSDDPEIKIDGRTLSLRLHKVEILAVDGGKTGPPEYRLLGTELGLLALKEDTAVEPDDLPDPKELRNVLSHAREFYPLRVYLPSNTVGKGYLLYPSWQTFHLTPEGKVDLTSNVPHRVPGILSDGLRIVIPYRRFAGKIESKTGLTAGVGNARLREEMSFSPTLERIKFRAGIGEPDEEFFLSVDPDLSRNPHKFFLADNTTADPHAVRLMLLECGKPIFTRGEPATLALRFLDTPGKQTIKEPVARMSYSPYLPSSPDERHWRGIGDVAWADGTVSFRVPDLGYGFYFLRVMVFDRASKQSVSSLSAELFACVIEKGQMGTASFISNKGRRAFVAGEEIHLQAVLRSEGRRPPGTRKIVLTHPDGHAEELAFTDNGQPWHAEAFTLPTEVTRNLTPGDYELAVANLPANVASLPFRFDLVGNQKKSLFKIIKPSKYTRPMNDLIPSHVRGEEAINLARAVASLAELGYNRIDLMSYMTALHGRPHADREHLAACDERLMPPDSVYTPSPRNQLLDACVRHRIEFSDVLISYNDFHLPRYIDGYIAAGKRWIKREMASMRHSPALAGMMLYDEMYEAAVTGIVDIHQALWPKLRAEKALQELGKHPAKIQSGISRYVARPKNQRDPEALREFLRYGAWERHSWGDHNTQLANAAREVVPHAKIGTYHRTWMGPGNATGIVNGYPPDLFENLDLVSHVHYADNSTGWVHSSIMASALRFGRRRPVFINIPLSHEGRGRYNGEYQRHMAFAMLVQGADGISQWGLPHSFENGPNPGMMAGKETTKHLNREILAPFGELMSRTDPGYHGVGIVGTLNQELLSEFKQIGVSHQAEELWVACWRLGYPATFLYEDAFEESVSRFQLIFVPGVRFEGELAPQVLSRLEEAIKAGTKVVVEEGSELSLPGLIKLDDLTLLNFFIRNYFPTWLDDELNKIFEKSQATTEYLAKKLPELGIEPAAKGPFTVGPNWRRSGSINYLVMANFNDPDYGHTVKQIMAKPIRMPLRVPAHRGKVAYDLLAQQQLPLAVEGQERALTLDMTRIQGGLVAFLPEPAAKLQLHAERTRDSRKVLLSAELIGASGQVIKGVFPTRIRLWPHALRRKIDEEPAQEFFRVLGNDLAFALDVPASKAGGRVALEVTELMRGETASLVVERPRSPGPSLRLATDAGPHMPLVPFRYEVRRFLDSTKQATLIVSDRIPGLAPVADRLVAGLKEWGVEVTRKDEMSAFRFPSGDETKDDPMEDGFHSWRKGFEIIQPATVVDEPVILMAGNGGSYLLDGLVANGFVTENPTGGPSRPTRPSIQVAPRGLHWKYDTLCLIANDAPNMRKAADLLLMGLPATGPKWMPPAYENVPMQTESRAERAGTDFTGNNEQVLDLKFDRAGNMYIITWGHGDNLYSLDPGGKLRFSRHLPEMGAWRLDVFDDRLVVATAAGSRLYQLTLDGKPISQVRLTMDPGPIGDDEYRLSYPRYEYLPVTRQILQNIGVMRVFDEQGNVLRQWEGEKYADKDVSDRVMTRSLLGYAFSPDHSRIAQLEASMYFTRVDYQDVKVADTHLVIRSLAGKLLHEYQNVSNDRDRSTASLLWAAEAPGPAVIAKGELWQFDKELKLLHTRAYDPGMFRLGGLKRLVRDGNSLRFLDGEEVEFCRMGPFAVMPTVAQLSPDRKTIAFLNEYGLVSLYEAGTGKLRHKFSAPQLGNVLRFTPDSSTLLIGGLRGLVVKYGLQGQLQWQSSLSAHNRSIESPRLYDPSFPDLTQKLWPESHDTPGELEALVRMGKERLTNGDCESEGGWRGKTVAYHSEGHRSKRSLLVSDATVHQEVTKYLGSHVTWVAEFFYRAAPGSEPTPTLVAGLLANSKYPESVARRLRADGSWQFARVVIKSGMQCQALKIGFLAEGGPVLVDSVTLRQIRFPSINHLLYEPLHEIEPVILSNPLFSESYDPIGGTRDGIPSPVNVPPYTSGGKPLLEPAFLQNGRTNEISSEWYEMPPGRESSNLPISMTLREPRWVSMVAIYLNYYDEANVTPHFDVYVTDVESKKEVLVASVRNNRQQFRLIKFSPLKAAQVKLELVRSIKRLRTVTELELYGPLSGREVTAGFTDPDGQNTYMGSFSRVDKRQKVLAAEYLPPAMKRHGHGDRDMLWTTPSSQILASEDTLYVSRTLGFSERYTLDKPTETKARERAGSLGFSPYLTHYGGLLLKPGNDGQLYCIDAASCRKLWSVKLGERLQGSPVALREDVLVATDTGKLYKLDLANGSIMMEVDLSGGVWGSLATDGERVSMITDDGQAQCFDVGTGKQLWTSPVARDTDSTPAVDNGVVYLGDQKGTVRALDAKTGKLLWQAELGQEFSRCPVVTTKHVILGGRDGKLAVLDRADGREQWSIQTNSRFWYEPVVLSDQILYFDGDKAMLASLAGGAIKELEATFQSRQKTEKRAVSIGNDPMASISYYKGKLIFVPRHGDVGHTVLWRNHPWHPLGGRFYVMSPKPVETEKKDKGKK